MSIRRSLPLLFAAFAAGAVPTGCATAPSTTAERNTLQQRADLTLSEMTAKQPALRGLLASVPAYAVFPQIGKGGAIVGGAYGKGILYENGVPTGFVSLQQASIGAQLGGQTFAELIVLHTPDEIGALKSGSYTLGGSASVVVLTAGAGASGQANQNTSAVIMPSGGLMVDVSVEGQQIKYQPLSG